MKGNKEHLSPADRHDNYRATHLSENAFGRQDVHAERTKSPKEALPKLLRLISAGDNSFLGNDSPDASVYSGKRFSDLESGNFLAVPVDENPQFVGVDSDMQSEVLIPEAGSENLCVDDREPTFHSQKPIDKRGATSLPGTVHSSPTNASDKAASVSRRSSLGEVDLIENPSVQESGSLAPMAAPPKQNYSGMSSVPQTGEVEMQKKVAFGKTSAECDATSVNQDVRKNPTRDTAKQRKFFSQPLHVNPKHSGATIVGQDHACSFPRCKSECSNPDKKKEHYVMFKTKSSKQFSRMRPRYSREEKHQSGSLRKPKSTKIVTVPAGRYFDALQGPELETLKDSEELLLPHDQQWPFLLRFPVACFGVTLGLGSQAVLWKSLATSSSMSFLHIPLAINFALWCLALIALVSIFITYSLKCLLYFEAVRREYYHPVRINFFFAPWISCMFLAIGVPPSVATSVNPAFWCIFMAPLLILELKIYGQWLSGGERRLSRVANPSTHLSLVGNFVAALLAAQVGWKEPAFFFWAVGCAHYLVLFVTLYQRLPTAQVLPKELHPVFFLFVAAPSAASVAWKFINGSFDQVSKVTYFMGLFLYASLVVRLNFFRGFQFSISWWAYTFPMTASAIATIHYSLEVEHRITKFLSVLLSVVSAATVAFLFVMSLVHFLVWRNLFPNDLAIAITHKRVKRKNQALDSGATNGKEGNTGNEFSVMNSFKNEDKSSPASAQPGSLNVNSDPIAMNEGDNDVAKPL